MILNFKFCKLMYTCVYVSTYMPVSLYICRFDTSLSEQASRLRLLHNGSDKRSGSAFLSQGIADRTGARGSALRHFSRDLPTYFRQSCFYSRLARDDSRREALADRSERTL